MGNEVRYRCPNGCEAGYVVKDDAHKCVECGTRMVERDQSSMSDFGGN